MQKSFLNFAAVAVAVLSIQTTRAQVWEEITTNVPGAVGALNIRPIDTDGTRFYVLGNRGVYYSQDNGNSFTPINEIVGGSYSLTNTSYRFLKYANGYLWIGSDPGSGVGSPNFYASLHRLSAGQTQWEKITNGFPLFTTGNQTDDIAYDASTGTYYAASALGGMFVSSDGVNWSQRTTGFGGLGVPATVVAFNGLAFASRPSTTVCRTVDQGANWTNLNSYPGTYPGFLLEFHGRVMSCISGPNSTQDGLYYTDDNGATWKTNTGIRGQLDLSTDGSLIYAGGIAGGVFGHPGIRFSANAGASWDDIPTNGLPMGSFSGFNAFRIVRQANYLFLHGVYVDDNNASHVGIYRMDVSNIDFRPSTQFLTTFPTNLNVVIGGTLSLSASAIGTNVTYQWRFNSTNILDATNSTFLLAPAQTNHAGPYTLVATGDRSSITSSVVNVNVFPRAEGKYDLAYNNTSVGGSTYLLPDGSVIAVGNTTSYKMAPDGTRLVARTLTGGFFPANLLDRSNRMVLAGTFNGNRVLRLLGSDLSDDASFHPLTANNTISSVAELPGRGYLVCGFFTSVTNVGISTNAVNRLCLIDYSGVVDTNFSVGVGPGGSTPQITKIVVNAGTNIFIAGSFTSWNDTGGVSRFLRLNNDGSRNTNFAPVITGLDFFQNYLPGKLFITLQGKALVVDINGIVDPNFNSANKTFTQLNTVKSIAVGEDNKIYAAGSFTAFGSTSVGKYLRFNTNGAIDTNFDSTVGPSSGGGFSWVTYDPRGYIYVTRDSTSGTFLGQSFGAGPYRLFAGTNSAVSTPFDSWKAQFTFPPGQDNPQDDADGDGVGNVFEYYFGSNPTSANAGVAPVQTSVNVSGQNYLALSFIRSKAALGVTLLPQASTDLLFNDALGTTIDSVLDLGNGTERVTIRTSTSMTAQPRQFLRILLSMP